MKQRPKLSITKPSQLTTTTASSPLIGILGEKNSSVVSTWDSISIVSVISSSSRAKKRTFKNTVLSLLSSSTSTSPQETKAIFPFVNPILETNSHTIFLDVSSSQKAEPQNEQEQINLERSLLLSVLVSGVVVIICERGAADVAGIITKLRELNSIKQNLIRHFLNQPLSRKVGCDSLLSEGPSVVFLFPETITTDISEDFSQVSDILRRSKLIPADASLPMPLLCPRQRMPVLCHVKMPNICSLLNQNHNQSESLALQIDSEAKKGIEDGIKRAFGHQQRQRWNSISSLKCIDAIIEMLGPSTSHFESEILESIRIHTKPSLRYSQAMCITAIDVAREHYFSQLPTGNAGYKRVAHETQLSRAESAFRSLARGVAVESYVATLRKELTNEWINSGRQLCEAISLSGKPCNTKHNIGSGGKEKQQKQQHFSGFKEFRACFCGNHQFWKTDSFSVEEENKQLISEAEKCCNLFSHLSFPIIGNNSLSAIQWRLTILGNASMAFKPGITQAKVYQTGFMDGMNSLLAISFQKQNSGEQIGYIGFEFECSNGHRFICSPEAIARAVRNPDHLGEGARSARNLWKTSQSSPPSNISITTTNQNKQGRYSLRGKQQSQFQQRNNANVNNCSCENNCCPMAFIKEMIDCWDLPLFIPCQWCKQELDRVPLAQLIREFIVTPPKLMLSSTPHIVFESSQPQILLSSQQQQQQSSFIIPKRVEFTLGPRLILPSNSMIVIQLPHSFPINEESSQSVIQTSQDTPWICKLLGPHLRLC